MDTRIAYLPTFVFSKKLIKVVISYGIVALGHGLEQYLHKRRYFLGRAVTTWDYMVTDRYKFVFSRAYGILAF